MDGLFALFGNIGICNFICPCDELFGLYDNALTTETIDRDMRNLLQHASALLTWRRRRGISAGICLRTRLAS